MLCKADLAGAVLESARRGEDLLARSQRGPWAKHDQGQGPRIARGAKVQGGPGARATGHGRHAQGQGQGRPMAKASESFATPFQGQGQVGSPRKLEGMWSF